MNGVSRPPPRYPTRLHFSYNWREQDAVAEMASGNVVAGRDALPQNRKRVRGAGTKAGPAFQNLSVVQFWYQSQRGMVQALDRVSVGALVEAGFFPGCAAQQT